MSAKGTISTDIEVGNGAALDVQLGYIPDFVMLFNATDGDLITTAFLAWIVPFSSGGTNEIQAGDTIIGATSGARARVRKVLLYSGSWAGGDAAGFLVLSEGSLVGTFGSEAIYASDSAAVDDATATANVVHNVAIAAAAAGATTTSAISRLEGVAGTTSKGFTIGSVIAEEAKLLRWVAFRNE